MTEQLIPTIADIAKMTEGFHGSGKEKPQPVAAQEKKRPPIERECVKCAHQFKGSWQTPCPNCEVSPSPVATTQGDDLPFDHDSYVAGFLECKERAARIVDEHDGYLGRVMDLDPEFRDNRVENFTDSQIITTLRNLYEVASGLCDDPIPLSIRSEVERILAPEPKPTPQAEGFEEWFTDERADKYQYGAEGAARDAWSAAQAPVLQKIAKLEQQVIRDNNWWAAENEKARKVYVTIINKAKARITELEKRLEKRSPIYSASVDKITTLSLQNNEICDPDEVTSAEIVGMWVKLKEHAERAEDHIAKLESSQPKAEPVERLVSDETLKSFSTNFGVVSKIATELLQRRQREERRER